MQKETLHARIGELTIHFATLEHQLQSLLKSLLREDCPLIGPFFIHELNLSTLVRKTKHIARYRLQDDKPLLDELERLLKRIDGTRDIRNLLVHGRWLFEEGNTGWMVKVRDFKMKSEDGRWQDITETTFTERQLTHLIRRLDAMSSEIEQLIEQLHGRWGTENRA